MALKKSQLYSSIWQSCDALRGGMDASQYKDYVLVMLFVKYVSDKYGASPFGAIKVPPGANFAAMVALKNQKDIGDKINTTVLRPLADANHLGKMPDFNDPTKLGDGSEMVDRLTKLIAIFENPALDFSKNRAGGDDLLGDAYEYLMRHFATQSGKSKGQFYTPAEVSRVMAAVLAIGDEATNQTTVYDPTCGSGSLLLKVADSVDVELSLYGQEKDASTRELARMNMILHNRASADIQPGNTLTNPRFMVNDRLKTFDYAVANPPFSDKTWTTGLIPEKDRFNRFEHGIPPQKQGDYAYLLHILRSLKSTGKGACILPHGVLFRGGSEAQIRQNLLERGYIEAIIGLPANLFYGTGIPACIIVLDKENAAARKDVLMVDASKGFIKDGPKNRLRERDIHRIVDAYLEYSDTPGFSRLVPLSEIGKNDFNLNIPRYIDSQEREDLQDIAAHLQGGIPLADINALQDYWRICPDLRAALFKPLRTDYLALAVPKSALKDTISGHPQFVAFSGSMEAHFKVWHQRTLSKLKQLKPGFNVKQQIVELREDLLAHYEPKPLLDAYVVYQHLMDYWDETMSDDCYQISADGWLAKAERVLEEITKGKKKGEFLDKGWRCDLVPKELVVARYLAGEQAALEALQEALEETKALNVALEEEHSDEEGYLALDKVSQQSVKSHLSECEDLADKDGIAVLKSWLANNKKEAEMRKQVKSADEALDGATYNLYAGLSEDDVKLLVVEDKWLGHLTRQIHGEMARINQRLTTRIKELADRYETPLPEATAKVAALEKKVAGHLAKMGFSWN